MRTAHAAAVLVAVLLAGVMAAQERIPAGPVPGGPTFDVASIKRSTDTIQTTRSVGERPGGVWMLQGMAIAPMIRSAYPSDTSDLIGAPDWVSAETYDVTAKASGDVPREQMQAMLRALLADRFKLAVHYEIQERPVYALVLARADGKLGPNIRRSDLDCAAISAARRTGSTASIPAAGNGAPACGLSMRGTTGMEVLVGGLPLSSLADSIRGDAGRVVRDKTGLVGNYEVTLRYMPRPDPNAPPDAPPTIFTALQEQLGLKLEADRAPLRVLVVDNIERPTDN